MWPEPSAPESQTIRPRWAWYRGAFVEGLRITLRGGQIAWISCEPQSGEVDREDLLLLPGLVNAHTHLEFSRLARPIPHGGTFASWIRAVVQWRRTQTDTDYAASIDQGLAESAAAGVSAIGEISTRLQYVTRSDNGLDQVVFHEALGLSELTVDSQLELARRHLEVSGRQKWQQPGLSPHAPYSLHPELFRGIVELARGSRVPVAMHLAETEEELELLRTGTGPLAELFQEWGLWRAGQTAPFQKPIQVLQALRELDRVLVIHGNYLDSEELEFLANRQNLTVVYCPRTHSYFGHRPYPIAEMLRRGIRVALGTDSRASNPDLNLLADLRHAAQLHPRIEPQLWLEMATRHGATALGLNDRFGSLEVGQAARFCELRIPAGASDPLEVVFSTGKVHSSSPRLTFNSNSNPPVNPTDAL